jgi:hypothetical protein
MVMKTRWPRHQVSSRAASVNERQRMPPYPYFSAISNSVNTVLQFRIEPTVLNFLSNG